MKKIFSLFIILLAYESRAFINIESLRKNSDAGFNKSAKVSFNSQSGNTDKILAGINSFNSYVYDKNEFLLIGGLRYGESFNEKDTEDGNVHLRYTRNLFESNFLETYTQYQYDKFRALNSRQLYGLGYRYVDKYFNYGVGAFYEHEELESRQNQDAVRGNIYISGLKKTSSGLEYSSIIYLQPSLKRSNDVRVNLNAGISQKITDFLNINIEYSYEYDEQPPSDIKRNDSSLTFGFSII